MERKNEMYKALVVTSRNVQYPTVAPVIEALQKRHWKIRVLHFERIWEKVEQLLSKTTKRRSLESFYTGPVSRRPRRINDMAYDLLSKMVFHAVNFLRLEKPSIVIIMTDSTPPCRVAVLAGKLAGIPSLLLLHSGMVGRNYECPSFVVDKIAVTGDFARKTLVRCGVEENKLVVTGRPSYDALVRGQEHFSRDEICRKLGLDPTKKIILYTTENLPSREGRKMAYAICRAVKEFSNMQLAIKVHPSELDLSIYKNVARELGVKAMITRQANIYEVLYICDIVITGFSATALDAMIFHKPVITINLTGLEDPLPFAESGAAIGVYKEKTLVGALEKGLYDEASRKNLESAREKFVYEHVYKSDGKATARVVTLIEQMVTGQ